MLTYPFAGPRLVRRTIVLVGHLALIWGIIALPGTSSADEERAAAQIHVVVFGPSGDQPASGAVVEVDERTVETDENGAAWFNVKEGSHTLRIRGESLPEATIEDVEVAGGEGAEVVVTIDADGEVDADIETVDIGRGRLEQSEGEEAADRPEGRIEGTVVSREGRVPVEGARVFVRGLTVEAVTDEKGNYELDVPEGEWDVSIIHGEYSTETREAVEVEADEEARLDAELAPASVQLEAFTVTVPRIEGGNISLLEERRETSSVSDMVGAEEFSKSGDSDAASALGRVTGLTVVDGRHVYVRGLSERYTSSLLNGSTLPSPDPNRRVVPLDLFPTSVLESVVVQKSYSADMPGEFGGGAIQMRTTTFPDEFEASADVSLGANTMTTFQQGLGYDGGKLDFLGVDDGTRALPSRVREAADDQPLKESGNFSSQGYSAEELQEIGRAMPNNYSTERSTKMPDLGLGVSVGDTLELDELDVGYKAALDYNHGWDTDRWDETYFTVSSDEVEPMNSFDFEATGRSVTTSGIFTGGVEFDENNRIEHTSLLTRVTDDTARVYEGFYDDVGEDIRVTRLRWLERQLWFEQLTGEHEIEGLSDATIDWRYGFGRASRSEPDRREYRYDYDDRVDDFVFSNRPDGNLRLFSEMADTSHDLGLSMTVPFEVWSELEASIKTGVDASMKSREVNTRRFAFDAASAPSREERTASQEEILAEENINPEGYQITETTRPTDNYTAEHLIGAPYVSANVPIIDQLEVETGLRLEASRQEVITSKLFDEDEEDPAELNTVDLLPVVNATWEFAEKMQLRAGLARTLNRPDFREMSPACFTDVIGGREVCGNPELQRAVIDHLDARWEWYPSRGESLSVGLFYKDFDGPIETIAVPGATPQLTYQNANSARNYGLEVEGRKDFEFVSEGLRDVY
ncbi:MAG: TonB-dependent receptor domain-containing protein, partial [Persicimonas sp.]